MYEATGAEQILPLDSVPAPSVGAPLPVLAADESGVALAYIVSEADPNWDGTYVNVVGPDSEDRLIAVVRFSHVCSHMFGMPNDEAFSGHPLACHGLHSYAAQEVRPSPWIQRLARMNSVHPCHRPQHYAKYRHFVFAFHDTTFECVAEEFHVTTHRGCIESAFQSLPDICCHRHK